MSFVLGDSLSHWLSKTFLGSNPAFTYHTLKPSCVVYLVQKLIDWIYSIHILPPGCTALVELTAAIVLNNQTRYTLTFLLRIESKRNHDLVITLTYIYIYIYIYIYTSNLYVYILSPHLHHHHHLESLKDHAAPYLTFR